MLPPCLSSLIAATVMKYQQTFVTVLGYEVPSVAGHATVTSMEAAQLTQWMLDLGDPGNLS